ncbi:hypothetical protein AAFF_G00400110 [Aldrovandia affinis]|uniref:Uncharacterized protein n=1 Tax=Aldrovandia affinis TaxID=143900 RepID=A0AAD7VYS2_9TELE|nr:hypothetical protein AAFF_G00400110 [Aldrovandia affinis]
MPRQHRWRGTHGEPRARKALRRVHPHTNRILSAEVEGTAGRLQPRGEGDLLVHPLRDLLGTHPTVDGAEEEIPAVLTNLEIGRGPFTATEFATVKSTPEGRKKCWTGRYPLGGP